MRPSPWQPLLRDVAIAIALLFVTWQCWQQALRHAPTFQMSEVHVLTGEIAGYTTIDSPEHSASPNITTDVLRPRSAFWLRGQPDNLLFYLRGSPWQMANDVPVGSVVQLELTDDPATEAARVSHYRETTFAQPLVGLAIEDDTVLSARARGPGRGRPGALAQGGSGGWGGGTGMARVGAMAEECNGPLRPRRGD